MPNFSGLNKAHRLQISMLVPLVIGMVVALAGVVLTVGYFNSQTQNNSWIHERLNETRRLAGTMLDTGIEVDSNAMQTILAPMVRDEKLKQLFEQRDREALLAYTEPMFKSMNKQFGITHLYFTLPDRVNFLRVHTPSRNGDLIDRLTTVRAQQTGLTSYGVEMGPLGTLTLRVVFPWRDPVTGANIGFVELGKEIDHIVKRVENSLGFEVHLLLHKSNLDEKAWRSSMATLGRDDTWDAYPELIDISYDRDDRRWFDLFKEREALHDQVIPTISVADKIFNPVVLPVRDMAGRSVADLVLMLDVTFLHNAARNTLLIAFGSVLLGGVPVLVFFARLAKRVQRKLDENALELKQRANTDALTGLLTRRRFDEHLEEEVARSNRYKHSISLLMIDIDHFKRINDTFGHQDGDKVLRELAKILKSQARTTDFVCRFGGEEFVIILPETGLDGALDLAHRINAKAAGQPFVLNQGEVQETITVSIGVSVYPGSGEDPVTLVHAADEALYAAKHAGRNRVMAAQQV